MALAARIADRFAHLQLAHVPPAVVAKVKASLLYTLSMGMAGWSADDAFWQALAGGFPQVRQASTLVTGQPLAAADAAFVNAALMCVRGQNDTYQEAFAHPGCVAVPAVLAVAEQTGANGHDVLAGLVAGYETLYALAAPVAAEVVEGGFRATSVFGVFPSAMSVARVLGLDAAQAGHALSIASQFASGTMQVWEEGTPDWRLQVAHASRSGLVAARLAERGLTGAAQALEGKSGFYQCFARRIPEADLAGWHSEKVVYKPFPGCLINQGPLHVLRALLREHGVAQHNVRRVDVVLSPRNANYPGIRTRGPFADRTGAVMSAPFMLEVMLQEGTLRQSDFDRYASGPLHAASERIQVEEDASLPTWGCRVTLHTEDGRALTGSIDDQSCFAYGWDGVTAVLDGIAGEWPAPDAAARYAALRDAVWALDSAPDVHALMRLCTPGA